MAGDRRHARTGRRGVGARRYPGTILLLVMVGAFAAPRLLPTPLFSGHQAAGAEDKAAPGDQKTSAKAKAAGKPKAAAPGDELEHKRYRNPYWELDLVRARNAQGAQVLRGKTGIVIHSRIVHTWSASPAAMAGDRCRTRPCSSR